MSSPYRQGVDAALQALKHNPRLLNADTETLVHTIVDAFLQGVPQEIENDEDLPQLYSALWADNDFLTKWAHHMQELLLKYCSERMERLKQNYG